MDQYNLIPNAFSIYSDAYEKIGEIGTALADPDVQDSPRLPLLQNQLITASSLFYVTTKLINLNADGDEIIGINASADLVNSMLINLKDACNINAPSSMPRPFTTLDFSTVVNGNYPVGGLGAILQSNGLTYLPLEMGAPGEVLTASPSGLVWSSVVGNGIPSGGTTGQILHKVNNTSYNVAWATLTPLDIGVSSSAAELNILDGATLSTAELNTLVGINTGMSVQAQLNTKASTTLNNGQFLVGNGSNVATGVTPTGDVTFNNAGVFSIGSGVIVDADINSGAAISRSKLASGNAYRIIVNDNTGVMSEAAAIAASRVIVSNTNGVPVASTVTTTTLGFLDASSSIQTQLNARLAVTVTSAAQGDIVYYNGSGWVNFPRGTNGQVLTSTAGSIAWGSAAANGLPTGGTTNQYLRKIDNTNYNTEWHTLELVDVTDVVATKTEVNLLSGMTVAGTTLNYVDISSSLSGLLNNKLDNNLAYHAIYVGGAADTAQQVSPGSDGSVLTIVAGHPTWQTPPSPTGVLGPGSSTDNAIMRWNGTLGDAAQNSGIIIDDSNNITGVVTLSTGQVSVLNQAAVRFYETGSTNYVGIRASGTMAADYTITLPDAAPASNTFLKYDGANYVWSAGGGAGTIGGTIATGQVAYASGTDTIAGEAAFTYNATDNILTVDRYHSSLASDPVATVSNGDLFYSSNASVLDYRARINGVWTNITRPGKSTKSGTYTISESERNYITLVDTSGGDITIDISVDLSENWAQTFVNTGANTVNFTAAGGMTLNAIDTTLSTQYGAVTLIRSGSNTYYAFGALGTGGGGGSGTVTSVSMTVPSFLSVAGSPITTSGTLAVTLATQSANLVFAGPTSGGAATPTFRALVATDIPDLSSIYVTSVSGTSNRITVTGGVSPVVDIAATYVGQSSITTLGTIATGVWHGTLVGVTYGGTGADLSATGGTGQYLKQSSVGAAITVGTIPASDIGSGAALTRTNDTNVTVTLGGSPTTALLAATSLTLGWTGQLAVPRGGTGLSTVAQGDILYGSATDTISALAKNTTATRYLSNTGTSNNPAWAQVDLSNGVTGDLPFANLTQIAGLSVLGVTGSSTADVAAITGTADQILRVNGAGTALAFGSIDLSKSAAVGSSILAIANGGTGAATFPGWLLASGGALTGNNTISGAFKVTWTNSQSANNAVAEDFTPTVTATANGDVLTAVNINPTISLGAFTGTFPSILRLQDGGTNRFLFSKTGSLYMGTGTGGTARVEIKQTGQNNTDGIRLVDSGSSGNLNIYYSSSTTAIIDVNTSTSLFIGAGGTTTTSATTLSAGRIGTFRTQNNSSLGSLVFDTAQAYTATGVTDFARFTGTWTSPGAHTVNFIRTNPSFTETGAVTTTYRVLNLNPTYAFSGSITSATVYGIYYNPTETGLTNTTHYGFVSTSTTALSGLGTGTPALMLDVNGGFGLRQQSPAQITSNQNNYAIGAQSNFRLSTDASRNITGLTGGVDGKFLYIRNVGSQNIVFTHEDTNSTAANRITSSTGANITIAANGSLVLCYDATASRWYDVAVR